MKKILCFAAAAFVAFMVGCSNNRTSTVEDGHNHASEIENHNHEDEDHEEVGEEHADHHHETEQAEGSNEIVLTPAQAAMIDFEVTAVEPTAFSQIIKCSGEITAATGKLQTISATSAGIVTLAEGIKQGVDISAGRKVMSISSSNLSTGNNVAIAEAAYKKATTDYERSKRLYEDKLIGQREFSEAEAAYLNAKAVWEPLSKSESGAVIVSTPAGGYISELLVGSGDYVDIGQRVATVTTGERMQLTVSVPKRYYESLSNINDATIRTAFGSIAQVSKMNGRVVSKGKSLSPGSNMIPILFEFDGSGRFPAGDVVEVSLMGQPVENTITVPMEAVTEQQGLYYVYIQLDEECYQAREVKLGNDDGMRVEITSGLMAGEKIVTKGAINVKLASFSGAIPEGHNHSH